MKYFIRLLVTPFLVLLVNYFFVAITSLSFTYPLISFIELEPVGRGGVFILWIIFSIFANLFLYEWVENEFG